MYISLCSQINLVCACVYNDVVFDIYYKIIKLLDINMNVMIKSNNIMDTHIILIRIDSTIYIYSLLFVLSYINYTQGTHFQGKLSVM